jgi:hypothetical protein
MPYAKVRMWTWMPPCPGPPEPSVLAGLADAVAASHRVMVAVTERGVPDRLAPLAGALACTLVVGPPTTVTQVAVPDLAPACRIMAASVAGAPKAAATLVGLLRLTSAASAHDGLVAESLAYSMLLAASPRQSARCYSVPVGTSSMLQRTGWKEPTRAASDASRHAPVTQRARVSQRRKGKDTLLLWPRYPGSAVLGLTRPTRTRTPEQAI